MSGVAKSTVSRYLNGGSVRPATGQKIKKIIEENNYEPNVFARLKAKESRVIGLTVPGFGSVTTPRVVYLLWVSKEDPAVGEERRRGVIDGLFSCGKEPTEVIETSFFFEAAVHNVEKLIEKVKKPAALICATDRIAQGAYKVFYEKNIAIPEEVSVVGFGDYETGELMRPPLTTVKFDWKNWGESSAETMLQMIQEKPVSQIQVNPYEFIERESVR